MKTFCNFTWVGWLNIILLQWLFFRLAYTIDEKGNRTGWSILKWVYPMSGWGCKYKYIWEKKYENE